jgi:hypothetical protein
MDALLNSLDCPSSTNQDVNDIGTMLEESLSIASTSTPVLVCDAGYGFPREKRPFQEKLNAISSQLSNFLEWQQLSNGNNNNNNTPMRRKLALVQVVGCPNEIIRSALKTKLLEKINAVSLPNHVTISCLSLEEYLLSLDGSATDEMSTPVYLSPDADESLDPTELPPNIAVVGLLIDRRVQPNRSKDRASKLRIVSKRWPLEECLMDNLHSQEPLNVDCILEGMQQWWWNCHGNSDNTNKLSKERFVQAASQAINHHVKRHPARPLHIADSQDHK